MRRIKKILFWLMLILFCFLGAGLAVTFFYSDKVEALVVAGLNDQLARPVEIDQINFSFFRKFPRAAVEITKIKVAGLSKKDEPFIKGDKVYLSFDLLSLIRDEMVINEISIENAAVNVKINKKGEVNYLIFKEKKDTSAPSILNIQEVNLVNVKIHYQDQKSKFKLKAHSFNSAIHVSWGESKEISCDWDGVVNRFASGSYRVDNIPVRGEINLAIVAQELNYELKNGRVIDLALNVNGKYLLDQALNQTSFEVKNGSIKQLLQLTTEQVQKDLAKHYLSGKMSIQGTLKDKVSGMTALQADVNIREASLQVNEQFKLEGIQIKSELGWDNVANLRAARLNIKDFKLTTGSSELRGLGKITDFKKIKTNLQLEGVIDIPHIVDKIAKNDLKVESGKLHFNSSIQGSFGQRNRKNKKSFLKDFKSTGEIYLKDLSFTSKEITDQFSQVNGKIQFNNDKILLDTITGKVNSTSFTLNGYVHDYLEEGQDLSINAKLVADQVKLEEFINAQAGTNSTEEYNFALPKHLKLRLQVEVGSFTFRKFKAKEITGNVVLSDEVLSFDPLYFKSCEGEMNLRGRLIARSKNKVIYQGHANLNNINMKLAFGQMENFGQNFILDKHLAGTLSTKVFLKAVSDKALNMDSDQLAVQADLTIEKGALKHFEPLMELELFLKEEFSILLPLENLQFKTIKNNIAIANQVITIPEMKIASTALNMEVTGKHSFDQKIDYLFKVKNKEIFKAKKQNKIDQKYGVIENNDNTSTLPLLMTGTVDEPKFSYDFRAKKDIVKQNWKKEGKAIKEVIKQEIREILGKDTASVTPQNTNTTIKVVWDDEEE